MGMFFLFLFNTTRLAAQLLKPQKHFLKKKNQLAFLFEAEVHFLHKRREGMRLNKKQDERGRFCLKIPELIKSQSLLRTALQCSLN